ncbi:MAG: hypothetical protein OXL37_13095 [Chloroflexota bacterium]|nr:hypothetical protein [Chloroflexota bacterium]MDE2959193.1 hypothetical protein [Chloroflexota bacterium]
MWSDNPGETFAGAEHPEGELAAFALNALDDAEFQAVFHHVIRCPHCQEVLLGFQETAARLTAAAPEAELPAGLKQRVLANSTGRAGGPDMPRRIDPDPRWSMRRLRRWLAPVAMGVMGIALVASLGLIVSQQQEILSLEAEREEMAAHRETLALASASAAIAALTPAFGLTPADATRALSRESATVAEREAMMDPPTIPDNLTRNVSQGTSSSQVAAQADSGSESVDLVKKEMSDMVEATVLSAQPETEKLSMTSPMGTETAARGLLMIDPTGTRAVLMVTGMPADSYQIWLVRNDERMLIDRIVVNEHDGSGVKELELDRSVFGYHEVALLPDERHGPTLPTGEKFLSARIIGGPQVPPSIWRGR